MMLVGSVLSRLDGVYLIMIGMDEYAGSTILSGSTSKLVLLLFEYVTVHSSDVGFSNVIYDVTFFPNSHSIISRF